ncbi:MAG: cyanophycinase [Planctomycetaceae bacterium]|nr:cyanophycinase [Planctomycetaceae bacterium]
MILSLSFLMHIWLCTCAVRIGSFDIQSDDPPPTHVVPFAPGGHLCLIGGGRLTREIRSEFAQLGRAGQPDSLLVIIPTASESADDPNEDHTAAWDDAGFARIEVLHTRDRNLADSEAFVAPLRQATAVWLGGGAQDKLAAAYAGTAVERILQERLLDDCVVGGTSAGAAIASRVMIAGGNEVPEMATGFDLLPNAILDQHFSQRNRQARLIAAISQHPFCIGLGLDEATAVIFHQRTMRILGEGAAHVYLPATRFHSSEHIELKPNTPWLDWTTFVRTQRERHQEPFPMSTAKPADESSTLVESQTNRSVPKGRLLIVGGGSSDDIWRTFVEHSGGTKAKIVILPTAVPAEERPDSMTRSYEARVFKKLGVNDIHVLNQTDHATTNSNEFCDQLANATGIWFGGGRQWRFVDAYEGTRAIEAMYQCLERGGIIGGSSAGASIQGELLIRGAPVGNQIMVQDGYRRGFGFLKGVGIDQHFAERNRFLDLEQTIRKHPSILGIGIDEATAILVEKSQAQVLGAGSVYLYDANQLPDATTDQPPAERPRQFVAGEAFDLRTVEKIPK